MFLPCGKHKSARGTELIMGSKPTPWFLSLLAHSGPEGPGRDQSAEELKTQSLGTAGFWELGTQEYQKHCVTLSTKDQRKSS